MKGFWNIIIDLTPIICLFLGLWIGSFDFDDKIKNAEVNGYSRGAADTICIIGNFDNCKEMSDKNAREFIEKVLKLRK